MSRVSIKHFGRFGSSVSHQPRLVRAHLTSKSKIVRVMADDFRDIAASNGGSVSPDDMMLRGWTMAQLNANSSAARLRADAASVR